MAQSGNPINQCQGWSRKINLMFLHCVINFAFSRILFVDANELLLSPVLLAFPINF